MVYRFKLMTAVIHNLSNQLNCWIARLRAASNIGPAVIFTEISMTHSLLRLTKYDDQSDDDISAGNICLKRNPRGKWARRAPPANRNWLIIREDDLGQLCIQFYYISILFLPLFSVTKACLDITTSAKMTLSGQTALVVSGLPTITNKFSYWPRELHL